MWIFILFNLIINHCFSYTSFQVEEQIELSLGKITSWFADNSLVSNVKKTNLMKFQQRGPNNKDTLTVSVELEDCATYLQDHLHVGWQFVGILDVGRREVSASSCA